VALLAPVGMQVAAELSIPPFLMALMIACGGNAAAFSPVAPTGVIAVALMGRIGLYGYGWHNYGQCLLAHVMVGFGGYLIFGGWRLLRSELGPEQLAKLQAALAARRQPMGFRHYMTLGMLLGVLFLVGRYKLDVGIVALCAALLLSLLRAGDDEKALQGIPWQTVLMVCGMTVLMSILERTGGIDLCTELLGKMATPHSAPMVMGLLTGALSAYSSSSGVVLPAFLPTIPGLISKLGGGDPLALADSVNVGAHLVDVSPLSTLGALCLAAWPLQDHARLYRQLLAWGMGMIFVGALYCYLMFGLLRSYGH
jgi:Na+/H+ antiporter NhaD/arsenite permease-like protein